MKLIAGKPSRPSCSTTTTSAACTSAANPLLSPGSRHRYSLDGAVAQAARANTRPTSVPREVLPDADYAIALTRPIQKAL
jgi:hypothetical protein